MKARGVTNARRRPVLRLDPSRTGLLRKRLAAELRRRFARLKLAVVDLVLRQDAFGLRRPTFVTGNVFCPTGPGGGVDPTCSPGGGAAHAAGARALAAAHPFPRGTVPSPPAVLPEGLHKLPPDRRDAAIAAYRASPEYAAARQKYDEHSAAYHRAYAAHAAERMLTEAAPKLPPPPDTVPPARLKALARQARERADEAGADLSMMTGRQADALVASRPEVMAAARAEATRRYAAATARWEEYRDALEGKPRVGVRVPEPPHHVVRPTANEDWRGRPDAEKVKAFQAWLQEQAGEGILDEDLWERYAREGFLRGAGRAFDDVRRRRPEYLGESLDFYRGTREEFLRGSFARPVAVEKVKLLAGRSYSDLEGVTAAMSTRMTRTLTDGLVKGESPREIARGLAADVDGIGRARAETIARTEIIRAHADGQLEALELLGVEEVGVEVEWIVTPDDRLCPECAAMEGAVLKINEARGLIPRHPNCRCTWVPVI